MVEIRLERLRVCRMVCFSSGTVMLFFRVLSILCKHKLVTRDTINMDPDRGISGVRDISEVHLWLKIDDIWTDVLNVPTEDICKYTLRPLKWLRFLGYVIYGREGVLLVGPEGPQISDDDIDRVKNLQEAYYYSSPGMQIPLALGIHWQLMSQMNPDLSTSKE